MNIMGQQEFIQEFVRELVEEFVQELVVQEMQLQRLV
ncbi:hypothetical protein A2U01_0092911, partial [Trifolium medium]|nr:hypothetical protein [Trifolium medium]